MAIPALQQLNAKVKTRAAKGRDLIALVKTELQSTFQGDVTFGNATGDSLALVYSGLKMVIRVEIAIQGFDPGSTSRIKFSWLSHDAVPVETAVSNYTFDDAGNTANSNGTPYPQAQFAVPFIADTFAATLLLRP